MVRLVEQDMVNTIEARDLEDGQIAIIVEDFNDYKGRIVQRYGGDLITIGMGKGKGWSGADGVTLKVRVLEVGETLIVE